MDLDYAGHLRFQSVVALLRFQPFRFQAVQCRVQPFLGFHDKLIEMVCKKFVPTVHYLRLTSSHFIVPRHLELFWVPPVSIY